MWGKPTSNDGRYRHEEHGTKTSGRGWRGVGVYGVQVYSIPKQEKRQRAGETGSATRTRGY